MIFETNNIKISYEPHLDGGGTTFGVNALDSENVKKFIKKGNIMEMCSGPGFMGFHLLAKKYCDELYLVDINNENLQHINETIKTNNLNNVKFIQSNGFNELIANNDIDTIISNPPHFKTIRPGGYRSKHEELISLDENMNFHKNFFKNVKNYLNKDGVIILVENCEGVTENDIIELTNDDFTIEYVEYNDYGWTGKSLFYTIILKLK
jgi:methylase of polypeptide subunit release factors